VAGNGGTLSSSEARVHDHREEYPYLAVFPGRTGEDSPSQRKGLRSCDLRSSLPFAADFTLFLQLE